MLRHRINPGLELRLLQPEHAAEHFAVVDANRATLREFDHRVLFQMSAADSSNLIDSPTANKLGFFRALAFSEEQGVMEKFRPYAMPSEAWLRYVGEKLSARPT